MQRAVQHMPPSLLRHRVERYDTVVIGAGQAGLAVGHHLASRDVDFVILTDEARIGDNWRRRWDSLRLFTPAARRDGRLSASPHNVHRRSPDAGEPLDGFAARRESHAEVLAALQRRPVPEIAARLAAGHRAYVAWVNGAPAAWGWVATREADIGETGTRLRLPDDERYLWNFVTLPEHRGRGIYPRLLDAIVRAESAEAARFWIVYAPENRASGAGIRKAGFVSLAELSFDATGRPALAPLLPGGDVAAARLVPVSRSAMRLSPCWRCVRAGRGANMRCADGVCACDYQLPTSDCDA